MARKSDRKKSDRNTVRKVRNWKAHDSHRHRERSVRAAQLFHLVPEALLVVFCTQALSLPDQPHLKKPILVFLEEE